MLVQPVPGSNVYFVRYKGENFKLVGPASHHVTPGWRVWCHHFENDNWPVTAIYDRKWDALAALIRLIDKPWTY